MSAMASIKSPTSRLFAQSFVQPHIKKTSKLLITGLCEGNPAVTDGILSQRASNAENISIWWRHHGMHENPPHIMLSNILAHRGHKHMAPWRPTINLINLISPQRGSDHHVLDHLISNQRYTCLGLHDQVRDLRDLGEWCCGCTGTLHETRAGPRRLRYVQFTQVGVVLAYSLLPLRWSRPINLDTPSIFLYQRFWVMWDTSASGNFKSYG